MEYDKSILKTRKKCSDSECDKPVELILNEVNFFVLYLIKFHQNCMSCQYCNRHIGENVKFCSAKCKKRYLSILDQKIVLLTQNSTHVENFQKW